MSVFARVRGASLVKGWLRVRAIMHDAQRVPRHFDEHEKAGTTPLVFPLLAGQFGINIKH
jgi:hypothetical protein